MRPVQYIREYFSSEQTAAFMLMAIAIGMIGIAFLIFKTETGAIVYGIGFGLIPLAAVQIIAGVLSALHATFKQRILLKQMQRSDHQSLMSELKRMTSKVKRSKMIRKFQEINFVLALLGIVLGLTNVLQAVHLGFAMALLLQVGVMICYDLFATGRAEEYTRRLTRTLSDQ